MQKQPLAPQSSTGKVRLISTITFKALYKFKKTYFFIEKQQIVELNGYVIILVEGKDGKIKLYGSPADKGPTFQRTLVEDHSKLILFYRQSRSGG